MRHILTTLAAALIGTAIGTIGLRAQTPTWKVYTTSNSKIPANFVGRITIDDNGAAWMSSMGLTKFDGTTWKNLAYTTLDVAHDSKGTIWCASDLFGGCVTRYDGKTGTQYSSSTSGLLGDWVTAIAVDDSDVVWIGCTYQGISRYDGTTWTNYSSANTGLESFGGINVVHPAAGHLWVGTNFTGLVHFDGTKWTSFTKANSGIPADDIYALAHEASGKIWVGTWGGGVASFDGTTWSVLNKANSGLPTDTVNALLIDASGNLWAGTSAGLARYNGTTWSTFTKANSELPGDVVNGLAQDKQGKIWIGTTGGLAVLTSSTASVTRVDTHDNLETSVQPNPARDRMSVTVASARGGAIRCALVDNLGRTVAERTRWVAPGTTAVDIDLDGIPTGVYHCIVSDGDGARATRVIVEH